MSMKIKTFEDAQGQGRYTIIGGNGEPTSQSEGFVGGEEAAISAAVTLVHRIRSEEVLLETTKTTDPIEG